MLSEQLFMGLATAVLCATGLWRDNWLLQNTHKGRRLLTLFGPGRAVWILRTLLILGVAFGAMLAAGIINPVRWDFRRSETDRSPLSSGAAVPPALGYDS